MRPRYPSINFPGQDVIDLVQEFGVNNDNTGDAGVEITTALAQLGSGGRTSFGWLRPGTYRIASTISIPANVVLWGSGPSTILQCTTGVSAIDFATGFLRAELGYLSILGVQAAPAAVGINLDEAQKCYVHDLQVWDFQVGMSLSSGAAFSAYNEIARVEVNRSTSIGIRAYAGCHATTVHDSRVFWSFNAGGTGVGIDVTDTQALRVENVTIESADTCVKIRNATGLTMALFDTCYFEPGVNPTTGITGTAYNVDVANTGSGLETIYFRNNMQSSLKGDIILPPEGFVETDGTSRYPFGGRYSGSAVPKRNFVYNGDLRYWGLPTILPGWFSAGAAPVLAENAAIFYSAGRSLQATATAATSVIAASYTVSDYGVSYVTAGVRYQIAPGNTGFSIQVSNGANTGNITDPTPGAGFANGAWKTRWVECKVDPTVRTGAVSVGIDTVAGTGQVLIDEIWVVAGRYNTSSTAYSERIEMLPSPITIVNRAAVVANETFGPINILTLPSTLAPPLDDFSTAPLGVVGALLRVRANTNGTPIAGSTVLTGHHVVYVDIPASGGVVAATTERFSTVYDTQQVDRLVAVRDTTITGGYDCANVDPTDYSIALVGWILA